MILKNKNIIIVGGSGLIGRQIVNDIFNKGGIAINIDIDIDNESVEHVYKIDITNIQSFYDTIDHIKKKYNNIDGFVFCAYPRTKDWSERFEKISISSWRKNIDMQLNSCFFCCQKILSIMAEQKFGSIVNIASIYGVVGNDFSLYEDYGGTSPAAYSAIKGGIISFTRYLASYYGEIGIRINCVSPGGILDNQEESFIQKYEKKTPLKRMGKPDDIAPSVSFLLSDESKYITGHNLIVDGGWTII